MSFFSFLRIFRLFLFGLKSLRNNKKTIILKLDKFSITLQDDIVVNLDGENGGTGKFDFEVLKQHVDIFVKG